MKIEIVTKNYDAGEKIRGLLDKKISKLSKYLSEVARAKVFLKSEKDVFSMEITVYDNRDILRAEVSSDNMFENLDNALRKIERQIIKRNTKHDNKAKKGAAKEKDMEYLYNAVILDAQSSDVIRTKSYKLNPMSVNDAIDTLELLDHNFYLFLNAETNQVNVLYKRHNGGYGVIEAEI